MKKDIWNFALNIRGIRKKIISLTVTSQLHILMCLAVLNVTCNPKTPTHTYSIEFSLENNWMDASVFLSQNYIDI